MEFYEVVKTRRSIRSYKPDQIPDDVLSRILEAVRIAPSGSNRQPWKFILVKDSILKENIAKSSGGQMWISEAPIVVVACCMKLGYNRGGYMGELSSIMDVSISLTNLILAACSECLGTCWIGMFDNNALKTLLSVPANWNVAAVMPLGYPRGGNLSEPGKRKSLNEIISVNQW